MTKHGLTSHFTVKRAISGGAAMGMAPLFILCSKIYQQRSLSVAPLRWVGGWTVCKPGSVRGPRDPLYGHSSGPAVAGGFSRSTRAAGREHPMRGPFSILLPAGLAMPPPSPGARWALTPPFHPCRDPRRTRDRGGLLSVALSLDGPKTAGRALPGAVFPWSPDFPHPAPGRDPVRGAAIRPSAATARPSRRRAQPRGVWRKRVVALGLRARATRG